MYPILYPRLYQLKIEKWKITITSANYLKNTSTTAAQNRSWMSYCSTLNFPEMMNY